MHKSNSHMYIIHGLSNLDIKTTHSSSHEEEEEKEVKRNWLELPRDVMFLIFLKLGTLDILCSAQWVCSSWWKFSKNPHLFRSIHVEEVSTLFGSKVLPKFTWALSDGLASKAIGRSCGLLVEFSVKHIATDGLLHYLIAKSSSALRCVRLVFCHGVSEFALMQLAEKHRQLEKLEIVHCSLKTLGLFHSRFISSMLLKHLSCYLPELRHLNLVGNEMVTDDDLRAILVGCPHLESLDLRQCINLKFEGDLKERCGNIKVLWLPNDSSHDDYSKYDFDDEYNSYFRMISDRDAYETESTDYDTDEIYEYLGLPRGRAVSDDES